MIKVFYSYAHEDEKDINRLIERYTKRLAGSGRIEHWLDRELHGGDEWKQTIVARLEEADLIVLLLSADFFASDFIRTVEFKRALERRGEGTAEVVPILLKKPLDEDLEPLKQRLQLVPQVPIYDWPSQDNAWHDVATQIVHAVDRLSGLSGCPPHVAEAFRQCYQKFGRDLGRAQVTKPDRLEQQAGRKTIGYRWPFGKSAIYWSARGGAHLVRGGIGAVHSRAGGCTGDLGFPLSDSNRAAPSVWGSTGRVQRFEGLEDIGWNDSPCGPYGASIYWRESDRTAAAVTGPVGREYERISGTDGCLGFPVAAESMISSSHGTRGRMQVFEGGAVIWCEAHGAHTVASPLYDTFLRIGGPAGRLGLPIGPEQRINGDLMQEFEGGVITVAGRRSSTRPFHRRSVVAALPLTSITAGSFRTGHQEVFVALRGRRIINRFDYGDGWSDWNDFCNGEDAITATTCCSRAENAWELYAVDGSGALRHRWYRFGDPWSEWHSMAAPGPVTAIASGSYAEGHQELFIADEGGTVFHRWQHGGDDWWPWTWMPAPAPVRALSCAGVRSGTIDLYAVDDNGRVHHRGYAVGGAWTDWADVEVPGRAVALSCGSTRSGHHEVFAALDGGAVMHRWRHADGWSAWKEFGHGQPLATMATVSRADRELEVFGYTPSGRLLKRWYRTDADDWSAWEDIDLPS